MFRGQLYEVVAPEPVLERRVVGYGGSDAKPNHLDLCFDVRGDDEAKCEILVEERTATGTARWSALHKLWVYALHEVTPPADDDAFPFSVTIERDSVDLVVGGEPLTFTRYTCGPRAAAYVERDGVALIVSAPARVLSSVELARLDEQTLQSCIDAFYKTYVERFGARRLLDDDLQ
jgi:hypothetical protein